MTDHLAQDTLDNMAALHHLDHSIASLADKAHPGMEITLLDYQGGLHHVAIVLHRDRDGFPHAYDLKTGSVATAGPLKFDEFYVWGSYDITQDHPEDTPGRSGH